MLFSMRSWPRWRGAIEWSCAGFGAFTVKHRAARQGRNPRTGETVYVEEKFVPFFKTGKEVARAPQSRPSLAEREFWRLLGGLDAEVGFVRRLFRAIWALPLAFLLVMLSVANRHDVRLVLDPISPEAPRFLLEAPLYVYLFAALMIGHFDRRRCNMAAPRQMAQDSASADEEFGAQIAIWRCDGAGRRWSPRRIPRALRT